MITQLLYKQIATYNYNIMSSSTLLAGRLLQDISTAYVHMRQLKPQDYTGNPIATALAPPL